MPFFTTTTKVRLFYTIDGPADHNGKTILLLHGWTCDSQDWVFQIPFFTSLGFRVIAPDLRGHGRSTAPPSALVSGVEFAADVDELLEFLEVKEYVAMGHSMGAKDVCAVLATDPRYRDRVEALVLIDLIYTQDPFGSEALQKSIEVMQSPHTAETVAGMMGSEWLSGPETPEWIKVWHSRRTLGMEAADIGRCYRDQHTRPNIGLKDFAARGWKERKVPWLVVSPVRERAEFVEAFGRMQGDTVVVLGEGKCGHWVHQERPQEFNEIVKEWLGKRALL